MQATLTYFSWKLGFFMENNSKLGMLVEWLEFLQNVHI
jgi:hypothetical protein